MPLRQVEGKGVYFDDFPDFFHSVITPLSREMEVKLNGFDFASTTTRLMKSEKHIYVSELGDFLLLKPIVTYEDRKYNPFEKGNERVLLGNEIVTFERNEEEENEFISQIRSLHPSFERQGNQGFFNISMHDFVEGHWFLDAFESLKEFNIKVFGIKELKNFKYSTSRPNVSLNVSSEIDWFDVDVEVEIENEFFTLKDLKKRLIKDSNYIQLGDGRVAILPEEWLKKMERYLRAGEIDKNGKLKVSKKKFSILEEIFEEKNLSPDVIEELARKRQRLREFKEVKIQSVPRHLNANLRDYQLEGFNWMCFLDEFGWGGILADDMGLGKTLQVLAFIQYKVRQSIKKPMLVVVPTSLLFNWEKEIEKFVPELSYAVYYGNNRNGGKKTFQNVSLVITSYGILVSDIELFKEISFEYVILDESQAIKNPGTQRFKAAVALNTGNRIAMTGTPIENNTFDLYAQMHFVNPGFLGNTQSFRRQYSQPIDKYGHADVVAELQKLINPFILRRTKELVATELPLKTEDVIYCEMGTSQRKVYDAYRNQIRLQVLKKIEEDGYDQSKMIVIQALTKLRQICNSPELLPGDDEPYGNDSVKLETLIEHINEKTGNHKILIFSQFVKMLELIKNKLHETNISFEYLDGKSSKKQREVSVERFQSEPDVRVFLISLRAGGTGLNLTAADYVYIVDPWWNPAVENQAIDRCYRIGQDKHVIAYRMICKDTIEDKIQDYKSKKQKIADSLITVDENMMASLNEKDIMKLFDD